MLCLLALTQAPRNYQVRALPNELRHNLLLEGLYLVIQSFSMSSGSVETSNDIRYPTFLL